MRFPRKKKRKEGLGCAVIGASSGPAVTSAVGSVGAGLGP